MGPSYGQCDAGYCYYCRDVTKCQKTIKEGEWARKSRNVQNPALSFATMCLSKLQYHSLQKELNSTSLV